MTTIGDKLLENIFRELTPAKLTQLREFSIEWQLSPEEENRRISLVDEEINYIRKVSPYFNKYYDKPIFPVKVIYILAGLRKISDNMLFDFIWDNALIPYWMTKNKDDSNWDRALNPSFQILLEFLDSPIYQDVLISLAVSGERSIELGSKRIPITKTEIEQHILRINAKPFLQEHIEDIEDDLTSYLENRHESRIRKKELKTAKFITIFDETQLITIYHRSKALKIIKCNEADFMFWFGGVGEKGHQIKWLMKWGEAPHKSALFWYLQQLNPKSTPSMMNGIFDIKVSKNNNQYTPSLEMENIFNSF